MVQIISNNVKSDFYNDNSILFCRECNGLIISDKFRGDTICENCGLVESEKEINIESFSKNFFENPQKANREWTSFLFLPDISYATYIDNKKYTNIENKRLIKIESWYKNSKNWSELTGIGEIKRVCYNLQIPFPTMAMSIYLFKKTCKNKSFKGRIRDAKVDGCIYYACRKHSISILYHEIIDQNSVPEKIFKKTYLFIMRILKLKPPLISPKKLLPKFIYDLGLNLEFEKKAKYLLEIIPSSYVIGKNPRSICAGILYITSKLTQQKISQKDIAKTCYVSEQALWYTYKELKEIIIKR